jgi:hypothetical protein
MGLADKIKKWSPLPHRGIGLWLKEHEAYCSILQHIEAY